jgi:catechol 2,3-dioxygenase-like lactoylglutathione lyase family enzyme
MIRGIHTMFYSSDAGGLRKFFRDKLGLKAHDVGGGWLIFDLPEADLGVHPSGKNASMGAPSGTPDISFYCDDIEKTVAALKKKGVKFEGDIKDHGYGFVTQMIVPGGFLIQLYQPKYEKKKSKPKKK